jgi:hypothetical protein
MKPRVPDQLCDRDVATAQPKSQAGWLRMPHTLQPSWRVRLARSHL